MTMVRILELLARFVDSSLDMHKMNLAGAEDLDHDVETGRLLRTIARTAREHGCAARVVEASGRSLRAPWGAEGHVLVTSADGGVLATRSARRLLTWLGY